MNQQESDTVRRIMLDNGWTETSSEAEADVMLVMTCSVRSHAEQRALNRIAGLRSLRSARPGKIIGVLGCMAQRLGADLVRNHRVDLVVGPDNYRRLPELIAQTRRAGHALALETTGECYEDLLPPPGNGVAAFVTVVRGCDNRCSYCIVPLVKGRGRSRSSDSIIAEVRTLTARGVRDITLLGQNVLAWQEAERDFADLLTAVATAAPTARIRFLTSHPRDVNERILGTMAALPNVCPFLHLPLQSGSDRILSLMNRGYTRRSYLDVISRARQLLPGLGLSTDIIVGFPSETEDDFLETLAVVRAVRFDSAYMYRFSARPGTAAAAMTPRVSEADAGRRLARLIEVQNRITAETARELIGKTAEILIEGPSPRGDDSLGRTTSNRVVIVAGRHAPGTILSCRITSVKGATARAEPLSAPAVFQ